MTQSIYKKIMQAIDSEGQLDPEFCLPDEKADEMVRFAPGAWDGMCLYHLDPPESDPNNEEFLEWIHIIEAGSQGDFDWAIQEAEQFGLNHGICFFYDAILQDLIQKEERFDLKNIVTFGFRLITSASKKEAVKLGLILLELFDLEDLPGYKEIIRNLAMYDEFTFYAGFQMKHWKNGNQEIFEAAKKVTGWGRIHLIEQLDAESEEMKLWLLEEGVHNDVCPDYSALTVYNKAELLGHLKESIDYSLYQGISDVIDALLSEEPVTGISAIDEKEQLLRTFIQVTATRHDLQI